MAYLPSALAGLTQTRSLLKSGRFLSLVAGDAGTQSEQCPQPSRRPWHAVLPLCILTPGPAWHHGVGLFLESRVSGIPGWS